MRSRVRERRTHGSVRGLRREPLVYSTVGKNKYIIIEPDAQTQMTVL